MIEEKKDKTLYLCFNQNNEKHETDNVHAAANRHHKY